MTFNKMGTVPLPLALHLAAYTVLGLFCFFAGALNLIDPVKIPHGVMFLAIAGFSWGYVFGILMARKEVVVLGFAASAAWLVAAAMRARISRGTPGPESSTVRRTQPSRDCVVSRMMAGLRPRTTCSALVTRLITTCCSS